MKGAQVFVVLLAFATAAGAAASAPEPAPSPKSRVCVPDHWQGLSFTRVEGKGKMILAKSAVDVDSQKAASEFIAFGGHHHHHHHHHRAELASETQDVDETQDMSSLLNTDEDLASVAKKHGKGVVKVIADFSKEKVYITYHKTCGDSNVTFCKVKDFDHPADLSTMLCLPEKAKKGGTIVVGGSLDVDMYFIKAKKAIVVVSLTSESNIPVSINAAKKCHSAVHTNYFNITKDIDEGFFDVPASCEGKMEVSLPLSLAKTFEEPSFGNPAAELFSGASYDDMEKYDDSNDESFFGRIAKTVAAFWRGVFGSRPTETNEAFISAPKIRMYGQA
ncbi:hypothetical protein KFL_000080110 [Klebsormidium nitens]|uniref:Uncharacterized protein n=1 Tax=Klebsormidium nitens TaxID=105231 RepID=A0A1Y1HNH7_KLENI|nr:hypothetical protein KFL_000080110 [Klebsormidium nitens]|eukprot:GAQ78107.1 hypothetical protein KFL_000080110 [Klebsormidium nitens]